MKCMDGMNEFDTIMYGTWIQEVFLETALSIVFIKKNLSDQSKRLHVNKVYYTTWKVSLFGVFLVRIFLHSDWIRGDNPYSVLLWENTDQENSEYGHEYGPISWYWTL